MKNKGLLKLGLAALMAGAGLTAHGQANTLLGPRFIVDQPASISGSKVFTYSSDASANGANVWGRNLDSTWMNVPVKKVTTPDSLGCGTYSGLTGYFALVFRGDCYFSDKALDAQAAGAAGIIIVQNDPTAAPINMAASPSLTPGSITIPVLQISHADGMAIDNQLNAGTTVTISLTAWGFGFANDLVMVPGSAGMPPYGAIPLAQVTDNDQMQHSAYNFYNGGIVANTGVNDATDVVVNSNITWTPTGGSATTVSSDSVAATGTSGTAGTITAVDSIGTGFSQTVYMPSAATTGMFTITTSTHDDDSDYSPQDNSVSSSMYVTDSIFCSGKFDPVKGQPIVDESYSFAGQTEPLTWGPVFYIAHGQRKAQSVSYSVSSVDTNTKSLNGLDVTTYLFQWQDADGDGLATASELTLVGIADKTFGSTDSSGGMFTVAVTNTGGSPNSTVILDSNASYWVAVNAGQDYFLGSSNQNYYTNTFISAAGNMVDYNTIMSQTSDPRNLQTSSELLSMIPFAYNTAGAPINNVDSVGLSSFAEVPAVALATSKDRTTSVKNVAAVNKYTVYPNPAVGTVHAKLALANPAKDMTVKIVDGLGRTMSTQEFHNVQNDDLSFSLNNYAAGQYYMVIKTEAGTTATPFTVGVN